jgi:hypothetical protein
MARNLLSRAVKWYLNDTRGVSVGRQLYSKHGGLVSVQVAGAVTDGEVRFVDLWRKGDGLISSERDLPTFKQAFAAGEGTPQDNGEYFFTDVELEDDLEESDDHRYAIVKKMLEQETAAWMLRLTLAEGDKPTEVEVGILRGTKFDWHSLETDGAAVKDGKYAKRYIEASRVLYA